MRLQDIVVIHHAVLWEWMVHRRRAGKEWPEVVQWICDHFRSQWPFAVLGDPEEEPQTFTVKANSLGNRAARGWNAKYSCKPDTLRAKALCHPLQRGAAVQPASAYAAAGLF